MNNERFGRTPTFVVRTAHMWSHLLYMRLRSCSIGQQLRAQLRWECDRVPTLLS